MLKWLEMIELRVEEEKRNLIKRNLIKRNLIKRKREGKDASQGVKRTEKKELGLKKIVQ